MTSLANALWLVSRRLRGFTRGAAVLCLGVGAMLGSGCADPVRQEQIDNLGQEDVRVLPGPLHRPGQPCLVCHQSSGLAARFTVAGTVFRTPTSALPMGGIAVQLIDASRRKFSAYTNCAGNFFVYPQEFEPVMPLWVGLVGQGLHIDMESPMNKDGDCATCHQGEKSPTSAGHVYLTEDSPAMEPLPPSTCGGTTP